MRAALLVLTALGGCAGPAVNLSPADARPLAIRPALNKSQQFGLEDRLTLRVRDEFLRDGRFPIVPEEKAERVVLMTIMRYLVVPTQYDLNESPVAYKLTLSVDLQFLEKATGTVLWTEKNMLGVQIYPDSSLPGGMTEAQAQEQIWDVLARDIVTRVIHGAGAVVIK